MTGRPNYMRTLPELEKLVAASRGQYEVLKSIADELEHRRSTAARLLLIRVVAEMVKARPRTASPSAPARSISPVAAKPPAPKLQTPQWERPLATGPVRVLLDSLKLEGPDGRPLHRYRLDTARYRDILTHLRQRAASGLLTQQLAVDAVPLALWAAAWFQREYSGGIRKYEDLGHAIGISLTHEQWRQLIELGLHWWKRPLICLSGHRHRLLTIAVEGGFPARVLEEKGDGWLSRYLSEVVGRLLSLEEAREGQAFDIAVSCQESLRAGYRQDMFMALAADLALCVVRLRQEAHAQVPGLPPSSVLDRIRPDWRDDLPIVNDTDAARKLIDGILATAVIARGVEGAAGCARVLYWDGTIWRAGVRLSLVGDIPSNTLAALSPGESRLHVYPHGVLARTMADELAILDPPGADDRSWRLRQLTRKTEVSGISLDARIEASIQTPDGLSIVMTWPGGEPVDADVLTFSIDAEEAGVPTSLLLSSRGSARLREPRAVIAIKDGWRVDADAEHAQVLGRTESGLTLVIVDRPTIVQSDDGEFAYRVEPGASQASRERIAVDGTWPQGFASIDGEIPLFLGVPKVRCKRGPISVEPQRGELLWRQGRNGRWAELTNYSVPSGVVDVIWRETKTAIVRDRIRFGILPPEMSISRSSDADWSCYRFHGCGGWTVQAEPMRGLKIQPREGGVIALAFESNPQRRVTFSLTPPVQTGSVKVSVPVSVKDGLAEWDGKLIPRGAKLTPTDLARLMAFGNGRRKLCAQLRGVGTRATPHFVQFIDELSLRTLAGRVELDLQSSNIDAWVELTFLGISGEPYRIQRFDSEIRVSDGGVAIESAPGNVMQPLALVGRQLEMPSSEYPLSDLTNANVTQRVPISRDLNGTWLIYLRSGGSVRSRPLLVPSTQAIEIPTSGLAAAAAIPVADLRRMEIGNRMAAMARGDDSAAEDFTWLISLVSSLDGVPAVTFDALVELRRWPVVLTRLLLSGDEAQQIAVWRLERELPFIWAALPITAWNDAREFVGRSHYDRLAKVFEPKVAAGLAQDTISLSAQRAAALDPTLAWAIAKADLTSPPSEVPSILAPAQGYVRRTLDRDENPANQSQGTSIFRTGRLSGQLAEVFGERFDPMHIEALDAPVAAALAARGLAILDQAQLRRCKVLMHEDGMYFAEGYAAAVFASGSR